jgi:uncharacterized GH25 family protein
MLFRKSPLVALAALLVSGSSHAHFIWLEVSPESPGTVTLRFSEEILEATPRDMQEKAAGMKVSTPAGASIKMEYGEDAMNGAAPGDAQSIIGTFDYGLLDRSEAGRGQFMLKYHARAARDSKAAANAVGLPVDLSAAIDGETMVVTVTLSGKPVEGSELVATLPKALEAAEATTDAMGEARFTISSGDWVAIRAMVPEPASGAHDDKAYDRVVHYSTLTFFHDGK